jgi:hypothetical protein
MCRPIRWRRSGSKKAPTAPQGRSQRVSARAGGTVGDG